MQRPVHELRGCSALRRGAGVAAAKGVQPSSADYAADASWSVVERGDWTATIRKIVPLASRMAAGLRPTWSLSGLDALDPDELLGAGVSFLLWDVDGTLTDHHGCELTPEAEREFSRMRADVRLRHAILSNCGERRFAALSSLFPGIPVLKAYRSGARVVSRTRIGAAEMWSEEPVGTLQPLRKPEPALIEAALLSLGIGDAGTVALIGDQYLTDVAAANLAGIRSIKIPGVGAAGAPAAIRLLKRVDRLVGVLANQRGRPAVRL